MKWNKIQLQDLKFISKIEKWQELQRSCHFSYMESINIGKHSLSEIFQFISPINRWITTYKLRYRLDSRQRKEKFGRYFTLNEIYSFSFGDCEEQAILLMHHLFRLGFPKDKVGCISLYKEHQQSGHLAVLLEHTEDILILDNGWISNDLILLSSLSKEWKIRGCFNFWDKWTYQC